MSGEDVKVQVGAAAGTGSAHNPAPDVKVSAVAATATGSARNVTPVSKRLVTVPASDLPPGPPAQAAPVIPVAGPTRPPLIPDLERVMRAAIGALRESHTRLSWQNVATEIAGVLGTSYTEGTLRRNAKVTRLPHPSDPYWL